MSLTILQSRPAFFSLFVILAMALPADASGETQITPGRPRAQTEQRAGLYSARVRRSTVMYLRLRLLELREAGLDRARAAIERRLSIDELLAEPERDRDDPRGRPRRSQPAPY